MANKTSPKIFYLSVLLSAVLVVLASGNARAQAGNNPVSPQPKAALLNLPVPPISGPGYQDVNIADAFQIGNRRGHDPFRKQNRRQFQNADANGGNTNYLLTVPVITLPGRALNVGLTLYYNSQMWTKQTEMVGIQYPIPEPVMVFDHDADWPAPGWLLSLGKVIQVGSGGGVLQDSDGTLHPFAPKGGVPPGSAFQTTDGSLIDYTVIGPKNTFQPTARFPNGTAVAYGACSNNACYATTITDANGNFISISYVGNAGPRIEHIQDSLGRVIGFGYDSNNRLVSIIAPGLQGSIRTIMRLHYVSKTLEYFFSGQVIKPTEPVYVIDGIYFPGTSTGYWFGDVDSYSPYGMISKVSQRRGMTSSATSLNDQGALTAGAMTRERLYNYPSVLAPLAGSPTYTKMTETWAGMDVLPAVTTYAVNSNASPQTVDTVYPDGTRVRQLIGQSDGLLSSQITYDPSGKCLQEIDNTWFVEDYNSPSLKSVTITDQLGQSISTTYDYYWDLYGIHNTNQIVDTKQFDYGGTGRAVECGGGGREAQGAKILRLTHVNYVTDAQYTNPNRHIFNLPKSIFVEDGSGSGQIFAETDYAYDQQTYPNTPGIVGYTDPGTPYRGNITQVTRYKTTSPNPSSITESRRYDMTGNLIEVSGPCCVDTTFTYSPVTQFAYPDQITRGNPGSTAHVSQSFTYDLSTGLLLASTDASGLRSTLSYNKASLRLLTQTLPAAATTFLPSSGYVQYAYDDSAMSVTQSSYLPRQGACVPMPCQPILEAQSITQFNGLGLVQQVQNLGDGNTWNAVSRQYDALGRLWKVSEPYRLSQGPVSWGVTTYDSLNRLTSARGQDGSPVFACFDETARPSSASPWPGQTVRIIRNIPNTSFFDCGSQHSVAPDSRETWRRMNALGQLAEVVEPVAAGSGSVFDPGNVDTVYNYTGLGLLSQVLQGPDQQERDFQYDAMGRLTAEYLPEKSRTLDAQGKYIGQDGQWSDVFGYDDRSNLVSHVDARGVTTVYDFIIDPVHHLSDPLNRLQSLSYQSPCTTTVDPSCVILPSPPAAYTYMPTGDVTRLNAITLTGTNFSATEQYSYDPPNLLATKTLSYPGQDPLVLTYKYDGLYRLREQIYPVEYGTPSQAQKTVDYTPGMGGFLTDLTVDGADYASQITYNPTGQATSITVGPPGAQQTTETYNYGFGLLTWQNVRRGSYITPLLTLCYEYYPSHQLWRLQTLLQCNEKLGTNYDTLSYDYDALGRLHDVKATGQFGEATWSETYANDSYGNRLSVTASGKGPDGSPIPLDGLAGSPTPPDGLSALTYDTKTNHVTTPPGFAPPGFAYDAAGNQIRTLRLDGSWVRYQYDQAGRLAQVTDDSGKSLEQYAYGADGRRSAKTNSGGSTYYLWDGSRVIAEYSQPPALPKWTWSKSHIYLGSRILTTFVPETSEGQSSERAYYHHPDRLGVRLISNGSDNTVTEQVTLPFGTLIPGPSADPINPIFTSYDRSSATGIDYAVNRYYQSLERFTQVDPAEMAAANSANPQGLNLYSYVANDPANQLDPTGLDETITCTQVADGGGYSSCVSSDSPDVASIYDPYGNLVGTGAAQDWTSPGDTGNFVAPGPAAPPPTGAGLGGGGAPGALLAPIVLAASGGGTGNPATAQANSATQQQSNRCAQFQALYAAAYANGVSTNQPIVAGIASAYIRIILAGAFPLAGVPELLEPLDSGNAALISSGSSGITTTGGAWLIGYLFAPDATDFASLKFNMQVIDNPPCHHF